MEKSSEEKLSRLEVIGKEFSRHADSFDGAINRLEEALIECVNTFIAELKENHSIAVDNQMHDNKYVYYQILELDALHKNLHKISKILNDFREQSTALV